MQDETVGVEFTTPLREFLQRRGYSHIISLGIEPVEINDASEPETGKENYWLEPVKPEDDRLQHDTFEYKIEGINEAAIVTMTEGKDDIQYMIKVPLIDYNDYLAKR